MKYLYVEEEHQAVTLIFRSGTRCMLSVDELERMIKRLNNRRRKEWEKDRQYRSFASQQLSAAIRDAHPEAFERKPLSREEFDKLVGNFKPPNVFLRLLYFLKRLITKTQTPCH